MVIFLLLVNYQLPKVSGLFSKIKLPNIYLAQNVAGILLTRWYEQNSKVIE